MDIQTSPETESMIAADAQLNLLAPATGDGSEAEQAYNYRMLGKRPLGETWAKRGIDNIRAIELALKIDGENRQATPE